MRLGEVLADQLCVLGGLAGSNHEALELGPSISRERVARVPQVVGAETFGKPGLVTGPAPLAAEGGATQCLSPTKTSPSSPSWANRSKGSGGVVVTVLGEGSATTSNKALPPHRQHLTASIHHDGHGQVRILTTPWLPPDVRSASPRR